MSSSNNQHTIITFADQAGHPSNSHEKINQKPLTRSSTGQSTVNSDARSVRSVLMKKMGLVKRRRGRRKQDVAEGPPYHTMDLETVVKLLKSDLEDGLTDAEAESRRPEAGFNEVEGEGGVNPFKLLLKQFLNIMVVILLIAMVLYIFPLLLSLSFELALIMF